MFTLTTACRSALAKPKNLHIYLILIICFIKILWSVTNVEDKYYGLSTRFLSINDIPWPYKDERRDLIPIPSYH